MICTSGFGPCTSGNPQGEAGRYRYIAAAGGAGGFEERNYPGGLGIHEPEIRRVYRRLRDSVAAVMGREGGYTVQYDSGNLSMIIRFDAGDWSRNLRINVHSAGSIGFEAVSSEFRIRDLGLRIDYCFFIGRTCPIGQGELRRIVSGTFPAVILPDVLFNRR
ncbi:MAG: hypothetical protein JXA20_08420 [Spirochaetes bacterium]|nr:hypothetical protein [Spirochaetota bacterium]